MNNRTTKTVNATTPTVTAYVYDAANQLKEIRQGSPTGTLLASMLYDDNGNMYQKTEGATTTTLTYNALNRLAQVAKTGIATQTYAYDAQGRRIGRGQWCRRGQRCQTYTIDNSLVLISLDKESNILAIKGESNGATITNRISRCPLSCHHARQ